MAYGGHPVWFNICDVLTSLVEQDSLNLVFSGVRGYNSPTDRMPVFPNLGEEPPLIA